MGRMMGFEPTYTGTTNRGLDRLATPAMSVGILYRRHAGCSSPFFGTVFKLSYIGFRC